MIVLRDYQIELSDKLSKIVKQYGIALLSAEVRTGKTFTALETIKKCGYKRVLFLTKKKAIKSITDDYEHYKEYYDLVITNYESLHKVEGDFDAIVLDECHGTLSGFPKPSTTFKTIKKNFWNIPKILLSGTPLIESASKAYPIFASYKNGPWKEYTNFYKWFKVYGIPKKIYTAYGEATDYKTVKYDNVIEKIKHLIVTFTQKQAGFSTEIKEHILKVKMKDGTYSMIRKLLRDKIVEGKDDVILADTGVKMQICLHQMYSGTIKLDSGNAITIDDTKAKFVKEYFKGKKIAIMYNFIQERNMLLDIFGDTITDNLEEFNNSNKNYLGQIVSTREGVSLREADALVFFNIPFSGTSYTQGKDRMSHIEREENNVYFIFSENGIEEKIYEVVKKKQTFTNKIFKINYGN